MRERLYIFAYKTLLFAAKITPRVVLDRIFTFFSLLWFWADRKHRFITEANIAFCFPNLTPKQIHATARATYRNYAYFAVDFLRNASANKEQILAQMSFENEESLQTALASNRPVIVQTAHYGNWELFSLAMAARFGAVSIVGRGLDSEGLNSVLTSHREQFDIELIDKNGAAKKMLLALKNRRILGVLIDQAVSKNEGVECEFFGRKITHSTALSVIAAKSGALIIPAFIYRKSRKECAIRFFEAIELKDGSSQEVFAATQAQSLATEKMVAFKPDEYFWFHRKFKTFNPEIYNKYNFRTHDKKAGK